MRSLLAAISMTPLMLSGLVGLAVAQSPDANRITGPLVHENLAIYFIRGPSTPGKVPLTLNEALAKRVVRVHETGNVNQLEIENLGNEEVFIQSGDIVKGGQQDRTLMVSLVLPPKSGRVSIASFCVEEGRWTGRGREDVKTFATSNASVPSREMKLAMKAPRAPAPIPTPTQEIGRRTLSYAGVSETGERQRDMWEGVKKVQGLLAAKIGERVNAPQSASSLQLSLENEKVVNVQQSYLNVLKPAGEADSDIIGYVFAVNGKLNSGDVYPSNGLFRKMWNKLLTASVIEAISHKDEPRGETPSIDAVTAFLAGGERGAATEKPLNAGVRLDTRDGDETYLFETVRAGAWVHRNYIAK